jgi:outer membrane immunogenic protein
MRRFIALTVVFFASIGFAQIASAGPERMEAKEMAPAPPPCDWSGFYIGVNAGITNFQPRFTDLDYFEGYDTRTLDDTAFIGGGQLGYNWQMGALVLGLEVDGSGSTADVSTHSNFASTNPLNNFQEDRASVDFLGTARIRVGVAFQNALIYVTGGGAYAHGNWQERYINPEFPSENAIWTGNDSRFGWTGGVGLEYMLNCHWSLRAETLYTHLEDNTVHADSLSSSDRLFRYTFADDLWSYRAGIDYKFSGFFGH